MKREILGPLEKTRAPRDDAWRFRFQFPESRRSEFHAAECGDRLPFRSFQHLNYMPEKDRTLEYSLRIPPGPEPFPVQEPPEPLENPDVPVREPDPEDPGQI
ncbi:MAG: hypothetical protein DMG79_03625 [Acidobacteria bacterium]|nr:MAG: hypothetical protein DMG79_03625 [Acidobacteriota bacterium]